MKIRQLWFLGLFLCGSVFAREFKENPTLTPPNSPIAWSEIRPDFRAGKNGELAHLSSQDFKHKLQSERSKIYPEFDKFSPERKNAWDLNYTQKQRDLHAKAQKDQEYVELLRRQDSTRKTEYFRKVLRSPLPQSFKGDPQHNPAIITVLFSFD